MKKKLFALIVIFVALCAFLAACDRKKDNVYFNDFTSKAQFTSAEKLIDLSKESKVFEYDVESGVFITQRPVINSYDETEYLYLFGLCSTTEEYLQPQFSQILGIKGDYAIVTRPTGGEDEEGNPALRHKIGVIKFRGENAGKNLTDFSANYSANYTQLAFVGDYIVSSGELSEISRETRLSVFYDYSRGTLLEKFRVRCGTEFQFAIYDDYLVATGKNRAYFYNINDILSNGYLYLDEQANYIAYPEDTNEEYKQLVTVNIFYLGNGWFTRTARMESEEIFQGYNMTYEKTDPSTGETSRVYANMRCTLYDAKSHTVNSGEGWLFVEHVANKYSADYYSELASYLNNLATFDEETGRYEYSLPYMDIGKIIKDGYSIVYYHYLPYADEKNYQSEITFCIMNDKGNIINIENMLMPTVFVDGVGVESSDPMFDDYYGGVYCFDKKLQKSELISQESGKKTYLTYLYHERGLVAAEIKYEDKSLNYGMVSSDGRIILPFVYDELSPYYGGYCIGSKITEGKCATYRIAADGTETALNDVVNVRQGVYVYEYRNKLGLKNYAGDVIMNAEYDSLDVFEIFLTDGVYQNDYVVASKDGVTAIYKLN